MLASFYRGKRVFLTGHTGFKGAWLALWLNQMDAKVGAYSAESPSTPSLWNLAKVEGDVERLGGDVRDPEEIARAMSSFQPDIVIHMAAQSLVRHSYAEPLLTFDTNVMGTANLLEAVRKTPCVRAVINVTSDKCYENREQSIGYREGDRMGGHDPYSASKGCAELVAASYIKSYFEKSRTAVASVRAGNVIGGGDFATDRLVPDMVRAFADKLPVHIRSPHATRPWQHVLEPLNGYLSLARKLFKNGQQFSGGWNFGPSDESTRTVGEMVQLFSELWGDEAVHQLDEDCHPHEATLLKLDCTKAMTELEWQPKMNFRRAMEMTASWYMEWNQGTDVRELTLNQIAGFDE